MNIIEDGYGGNNDPIDPLEDLVREAYYMLRNASTDDIETYYQSVQEALGILAEAIDLIDMEVV